MKILKSLILGTAAIFAASWGAQAADLPVKAKPVEYVKICSAYGAGFYYIPGTDICLRVGGYVWYTGEINQRGEGVDIGNVTTATGRETRNDGYFTSRVRAVMIMDARTNTQFGTLRSYIALGEQWTTNNVAPSTQSAATATAGLVGDGNVYMERAFIQFAGWTFGYVGSFFDFNPNYSMVSLQTTSFKWTPVVAYTIQWGAGVSSTFSMEDSTVRRNQIQTGAYTPAALGVQFYGSSQMPDFVANLRADGPWGSAQVSGIIHQLLPNLAAAAVPERLGWAINGGIELKVPSGPGDSLMIQGVYANGVVEATGFTNFPVLTFGGVGWTNGAGIGPVFDSMDSFIAGGVQNLTTSYAANFQFRHFWNPMLRSAVWVGVNRQDLPASANAAGFPDLTIVQAGLNTIWSPVKDLDLGVEIMYTNLKTTCTVAAGACVGGAAGSAVNGNATDSVWSGMFRARRNW